MTHLEKIKSLFENYHGEDFIFRPFSRADAFPLMDATRYPEFNEYLVWDAPDDVASMVLQVEKLLREARLGQLLPITVCDKITGDWIGFFKYSQFQDSIEISMWFHPEYWRTMVIFSASNSMIDVIFKDFDFEKIYLRVQSNNTVLKQLAHANGFEYTGQSQIPHQRGHMVDFEVLELERKNWEQARETEEN